MSVLRRSFDDEMPNIKLFTCICPHCQHERLAIENGRPIQAKFCESAVDSKTIQCSACGRWFERKEGMRAYQPELLERTA
jgi:transcription elongation factor Elf1